MRALFTSVLALSFPASAYAADPKIINGETASADDFPMAGGALLKADLTLAGRTTPLNMLVCSSTLIAPDVVLLAAHCIDETAITLGFGELTDVKWGWTRQADLSEWDGTSRTQGWPDDAVGAIAVVGHDEFSMSGLSMGIAENFDVALMFLEEPLLDAPLGYLPTRDEAKEIAVDREVWIVGWGQQVDTEWWETPPAGTYAVKHMALTAIAEVGDPEFQVGPTEESGRKCHGDSGGPTFMEVGSESTEPMRVIGVTSHAYDQSDCAEVGGVDTRVDHYLDWIDAEMTQACDDGTRVWCDVPGILPAPIPEIEDDSGDPAGGVADSGEKPDATACGCQSVHPPALWLGLGFGWLVARTRRRAPTPTG